MIEYINKTTHVDVCVAVSWHFLWPLTTTFPLWPRAHVGASFGRVLWRWINSQLDGSLAQCRLQTTGTWKGVQFFNSVKNLATFFRVFNYMYMYKYTLQSLLRLIVFKFWCLPCIIYAFDALPLKVPARSMCRIFDVYETEMGKYFVVMWVPCWMIR